MRPGQVTCRITQPLLDHPTLSLRQDAADLNEAQAAQNARLLGQLQQAAHEKAIVESEALLLASSPPPT
jgi:hypothetical protein